MAKGHDMQTHPNEVFRRQRGHIETLQGQVKNLQAANLSLLFKVVFGTKDDLTDTWTRMQDTGQSYNHKPTRRARRVRKEQA